MDSGASDLFPETGESKTLHKKYRAVGPAVEDVPVTTLMICLCPPSAVITAGEFLGYWFPTCFD